MEKYNLDGMIDSFMENMVNEDLIKTVNRAMKQATNGDWYCLALGTEINGVFDNMASIMGKPSDEDFKYVLSGVSEKIKRRLDKYAGEMIVEYRIYDNGNVGYRLT